MSSVIYDVFMSSWVRKISSRRTLAFIYLFVCFDSVVLLSSSFVVGDRRTTDLTCNADYHGDIQFNILIPKYYYATRGVLGASFYYQGNREKDRWSRENDCELIDGNKTLFCTMRQLSKKTNAGEFGATFKFKLSIVTTDKNVTNISDIRFADRQHYRIDPWTTLNRVSRCSHSVGVKYLALYASYTNITVEWIRYPLDIAYSTGKTSISITGQNINFTNTVSLQRSCKKDLCTYTHQSLRPCSNYEICIVTVSADLRTEKCKHVNTYCRGEVDHSILWQDTLLIVFGAIILTTFISMGIALFNKYKITDDAVVDDPPVMPRRPSTDNNCENHVYEYPDIIKAIETDLLWTSLPGNPDMSPDISPDISPNNSSETMLSEC